MTIRIEKIRLKELDAFVKSRDYNEMETVPISPARVRSYLSNPNGAPGDVVLYLGYIGTRLVAFRSLLAGKIFPKNGDPVRFGWCSGNWVHSDHRRKGFSEQLLKEACIDWDNKLMFTNYAPESEKLYLKTGLFKAIHQFSGARAYLYAKTRQLHPKANRNHFLRIFFSLLDIDIQIMAALCSAFYQPTRYSSITFEELEFPDKDCYQLLEKRRTGSAFQRGEKELRWIFQYPWIREGSGNKQPGYPFSSWSDRFYYRTVKVFSANNFEGFFSYSVRDGHLKTLLFVLPDGYLHDAATFLKQKAVKGKIEVLTLYNSGLAAHLLQRKFPFLYVKKYGQKIYSTFEVKGSEQLDFQDGDGDVIFT